jgi:pro-apoptotic serine protease NMA111
MGWGDDGIDSRRRRPQGLRYTKPNHHPTQQTGDVLLSVNGCPVVRPHEVDLAVRASAREGDGDGQVAFEVLRDHAEVALPPVAVAALSTLGTDRLVNWAGLLIQEPHLPVAMLGYLPAGVYVSRWSYGSPAHKYGLRASFFITEIGGVPTPTLDAFLAAVTAGGKKSAVASAGGAEAGADKAVVDAHGAVRVKGLDLDGKPRAYSLKPVPRYWPTSEVRWDREKMEWTMVKHADPAPAPLHAA